ncbi:40S ribosomal protein S7-like, partial [Zingiber officinale]|uniref:40S ribosomal protein S7-like n=1 Tax=Zingiber officinale TaxID=94328 RepID=UPI001C4B80A6
SEYPVHKEKGLEPTEFEDTVAQAFFDLENGNQELKSDLKDLYINSAVQIDIAGNRKSVAIHVPCRLRKSFKKIQVRLVRELEKKFSGKDVVLIATRRILKPPKKGSAVVRPRSRTLTAIHDAILEDVVFPAEIVRKWVRYRLDGSKIIKIFLDPKELNNTEYKLETFSGVYHKLCGKDVVFEYPVTESAQVFTAFEEIFMHKTSSFMPRELFVKKILSSGVA